MTELTRYSEFRPTQFDSHINIDDEEETRENWIVIPVSRNRDSISFDNANFDAAIEILGGESETVEIHRFGHWGHGWFEIIMVSPEREADAESIAESLETYPILSEEKLSEYETKEEEETWQFCVSSDFERALEKEFDTNLDIDADTLWEIYRKASEESNSYVEHTSEGACFPIDDVVSAVEFEDIEPYINRSVSLYPKLTWIRQPKTAEELKTIPRRIIQIDIYLWETDNHGFTLTPPVIPFPETK